MNKWLITLTISLLATATVQAHHGWRWTSDTDVEVTGVVDSATLGNPHGIVVLDVEGEKWIVEVGQPWRNERAGLTDDMMGKGREITVEGQRSSDPKELRVKAETLTIKGKLYVLYPDRI